jgi:putative endonuclease
MTHHQKLGKFGEDLACVFLQRQGMIIMDRNWRCDIGEVDIIARDSNILVFCEVKTRSGNSFGHPVEAVSDRKIRRLRRLALRWLDDRSIHAPRVRFDVVGIIKPRIGDAEITHIPGVDITWR